MTNYEYILNECKRAHYGKWDLVATRECVYRLKGLSREEQLRLFTSRWLSRKCELLDAIFIVLFKKRLEQCQKRIRNATIAELDNMPIDMDGS